MSEITIYPIEALQVAQYCALIIGAISCLVHFLVSVIILEEPKIKTLAWWMILVCVVIGSTATAVRSNLQCKQDHVVVFAELPLEWVEFSKALARLKRSDLQYEAIKRFIRSNPPRLTAENYVALRGSKLWKDSRTRVHKSFIAASELLYDLVILDFVKEESLNAP